MQSFAFTSRPQKHQHQWNYSPPGMKEVRFYGTRISQKIKTAHPSHPSPPSSVGALRATPIRLDACQMTIYPTRPPETKRIFVGAIVPDRPCRNCEIAFDLTYTAIPASQGVARNAPTWDCWCILRDIVIRALAGDRGRSPLRVLLVEIAIWRTSRLFCLNHDLPD